MTSRSLSEALIRNGPARELVPELRAVPRQRLAQAALLQAAAATLGPPGRDRFTTMLALLATNTDNTTELLRQHRRKVQPHEARIFLIGLNPAIDVFPDGSLYLGGAAGTIGEVLAGFHIPTITFGFLGSGPAGELFIDMARDKGIDTSYLTRVEQDCGFTVYTSRTEKIPRSGPMVAANKVQELIQQLRATLLAANPEHPPLVLASGSVPRSEGYDAAQFYADVIQAVRDVQANRPTQSRIWVDAHGPALEQALKARPDYVKINDAELAELVKNAFPARATRRRGPAAVAETARFIVESFRVPKLTVTMGRNGALTATQNSRTVVHAWTTNPLPRPCTRGLGDTMLATQAIGETLHLREYSSLEAGVAAARAAAEKPGTTLAADLNEIRDHLSSVKRKKLTITCPLDPPPTVRELINRVANTKPPVIVADMDGTITKARSSIEPNMLATLIRLLDAGVAFAILTSSGIEAVQSQILTDLLAKVAARSLRHLSIFPAQGSQGYTYDEATSTFACTFLLNLTDHIGAHNTDHVKEIIVKTARRFQINGTAESLIEDRESQLTLMVLGRTASTEAKDAYDKRGGQQERSEMAEILNIEFRKESLPLHARPAGKSSINITPEGIDKGFGIRKIADVIHRSCTEMIYLGDELWPGAVDAPVIGQVMAVINVGTALPSTADSRGVIEDVRLGPLGANDVLSALLTRLAAAQPEFSQDQQFALAA